MFRRFIGVSDDFQTFLVGERAHDVTGAATGLRFFTDDGQPLDLTTGPDGNPFLRELPWRTTQGEALFRLHRAVLARADQLESHGPQYRPLAQELRSICCGLPGMVDVLLSHQARTKDSPDQAPAMAGA